MKIKRLFIIPLFLLFNCALQAYLVNGSIYEKNGQFIINLGVMHTSLCENDLLQIKKIKIGLEKYKTEDVLAIIEDLYSPNSYNCKKFNLRQQKITNKLISTFKKSPTLLDTLYRTLDRKKIKVINAECRQINSAYIEYISGTTIEDVEKELANNIEQVNEYIKEIQHSKMADKTKILDFYQKLLSDSKTSKKQFDAIKKTEKLLEVSFLNIPRYKKFAEYSVDQPFVEANMLYNIIKNPQKKIILMCSGSLHKENIEKILEKTGYKKIKHIGPQYSELIHLIQARTPIASIDVETLFESVKEENTQKLYTCALCQTQKSKHDIKKCARCQQAYYCSRKCQIKHWKAGHKKVCKKTKVTSL